MGMFVMPNIEKYESTEFKISVLIPVYNVELYVAYCIRSLFANTIADECEFIIVDDCSSDKSMQVISDVLNDFPNMTKNVELRSHDYNRGSAAARNTALLRAHGKYIICVDSDDWVEPDYLEELYDEAERCGADVTMCDYYLNEANIKQGNQPADRDAAIRALFLGNMDGYLWQKLFRCRLLLDNAIHWVEGIDVWEDVLLVGKLLTKTSRIAYVRKPLYHYRTNPLSLVHTLSGKKLNDIIHAVNGIEEFYTSEGIAEKFSDSLLTLKARAKIVTVIQAQKYMRKEFLNTFREADALILRVRCAPFYNRVCAWLYLHHAVFPADSLMWLKRTIKKKNIFQKKRKV